MRDITLDQYGSKLILSIQLADGKTLPLTQKVVLGRHAHCGGEITATPISTTHSSVRCKGDCGMTWDPVPVSIATRDELDEHFKYANRASRTPTPMPHD